MTTRADYEHFLDNLEELIQSTSDHAYRKLQAGRATNDEHLMSFHAGERSALEELGRWLHSSRRILQEGKLPAAGNAPGLSEEWRAHFDPPEPEEEPSELSRQQIAAREEAAARSTCSEPLLEQPEEYLVYCLQCGGEPIITRWQPHSCSSGTLDLHCPHCNHNWQESYRRPSSW